MANNKSTSTCPTCQALIAPSAPYCNCTNTASSERPSASATLVAQAESVFESYLAARVLRARRDLTAAKVALLRDPKSREKLEAIQRAQIEIEQLQAQLVEQTRKASQARSRLVTGGPKDARYARDINCPKCDRLVSADAKSCRCGYSFGADARHMTATLLRIDDFLAQTPRRPRK